MTSEAGSLSGLGGWGKTSWFVEALHPVLVLNSKVQADKKLSLETENTLCRREILFAQGVVGFSL